MFIFSKILCDYIISLAYQTKIHTHIKQHVKLNVWKTRIYLVLLNLKSLVCLHLIFPLGLLIIRFTACGTVLERAQGTAANACRSQHRLHCKSPALETLPLCHGKLLSLSVYVWLNP